MKTLSHFDKLVIHASKKHWCYRLYCTTCGNMEFRNGMEIVGQGKNPLKQVDRLTQMRPMWHDNPEAIAERSLSLAGQVINANIARYYHDCCECNWLGFMGLALQRFETFQPGNLEPDYLGELYREHHDLILKLISASWSKKFYELFRGLEPMPGAERSTREAMIVCKNIMHRERERFQIRDLETMETAFFALHRDE